MRPDEETAPTDLGATDLPEEPESDDRLQQLATLAILAVVGIAFLAICLPMFIL